MLPNDYLEQYCHTQPAEQARPNESFLELYYSTKKSSIHSNEIENKTSKFLRTRAIKVKRRNNHSTIEHYNVRRTNYSLASSE